MRVLEVSLRKAGFTVTTAISVLDAFDKLELGAPDLIISETTFPDGDGFDLRKRVRARAEWDEIPFIFLTAEAAIENKIRGLELGVDDYLTKPIYIKEIVARARILIQKRQRTRLEERREGRTRFSGRISDMPVVSPFRTDPMSLIHGMSASATRPKRSGDVQPPILPPARNGMLTSASPSTRGDCEMEPPASPEKTRSAKNRADAAKNDFPWNIADPGVNAIGGSPALRNASSSAGNGVTSRSS